MVRPGYGCDDVYHCEADGNLDVDLKVVGEPATKWMAIAQCFAGPVENPPAPGSRRG